MEVGCEGAARNERMISSWVSEAMKARKVLRRDWGDGGMLEEFIVGGGRGAWCGIVAENVAGLASL